MTRVLTHLGVAARVSSYVSRKNLIVNYDLWLKL